MCRSVSIKATRQGEIQIVLNSQSHRISGADPGFGQGGAPTSETESCRCSEASNLQPGSRACLRALEAFGFLMLKYSFSHIPETLFSNF